MRKITTISLAVAMAGALLTGCATGDENEGTLETGQVKALLHTQYATGARGDATLHAYHFDGSTLNSAGREKLDLMLADREPAVPGTPQPVTVYLDTAGGDANGAAHQDAVVDYLTHHGLASADVKVVEGPNPGASHPVDDNLAQLNRMESHEGGATGASSAPPDLGFGPSGMGGSTAK